MENLKVVLLQIDLVWENPSQNIANLTLELQGLKEADLIVLPEMFTTGFSMNPAALAEPMGGTSMQWMERMATEKNAAICGSLIIQENGKFFNRFIWMNPDGSYQKYDKKHLFSMAKEEEYYTAGNEKLLIEYRGWKIAPFICYDLRFPVWCRNTTDYDLALYVANWPDRRAHHWKSLLMARAIENQAYIVAVNRVGTDGKGLYYSGWSSVMDAAGEIIWQLSDDTAMHSIILSKSALMEIRKNLPFLKDRD